MKNTKVISLGGSIVAPEGVDTDFLGRFKKIVSDYLGEDPSRRLILVIGGGGPARAYQKAYRDTVEDPRAEMQDWIGIAATRLNGQLLAGVFENYCENELITDPTAEFSFAGRVLVAAGWKPGFSTDYDAVVLAERFSADTVINLSNIPKVYSEDPKINPRAVPLDSISWSDFRKMVGTEWKPGINLPFDPIATKKSAELGLKVIVAAGTDLGNVEAILKGRPFEGTTIG